MAINKKLIHFRHKADFDEQLAAGNILDTSIVWIKDAKLIYTHGEFYGGINNFNGALTYVNEIIKGERYDTNTGVITPAEANHYRTTQFATLGPFLTTFRLNATNGGTVWVHGWDTHGNYTGSLSQEIAAGTTTFEWDLRPSAGDAYYAFDFITQDEDASTIYVDVTYKYAMSKDVPTKVSQLTNDSQYATMSNVNSALSNKADKYKTQDISNTVWENSGSCELQPNIYYIVNQNSGKEIPIIDVSLISPTDTTIVNEYFIQFSTPSTGATLIMPANIKWLNNETPILQPSKTYQLSIINNLAIIGVFG